MRRGQLLLFEITVHDGVLTVNYFRKVPPSRLLTAQVVCSGTAQPDIRRVRMVGWRLDSAEPYRPGQDFRHPPPGWTAHVGPVRKCPQYADLMAP